MRFTCNTHTVVAVMLLNTAVNGQKTDFPGGDFVAFLPLATDGQEILEKCNLGGLVDLFNTASSAMDNTAGGAGSDLLAAGSNPMGAAMDGLAYIQELAKQTCSESQKGLFSTALENFHTCAGFDLSAFIEELPSAIVGTELECVLTFFAENDIMVMAMTGETPQLPERCAHEILGSNPFGDLLRNLYLHPDKTLPCFKKLENDIPSCIYYEAWPMPLVGPWLKSAACVLGESSKLVDDLCEIELGGLDSCLPTPVPASEGATCDDAVRSCAVKSVTMNFPKPFLGAPLPDACTRVAKERGLGDALTHYSNFKSVCFTDEWSGWSVPNYSGNSKTVGVKEKSYAKVQAAAAPADSSPPPPSGGTAGAFFGGAVIGMILVAAIAYRREKQANRAAVAAGYVRTGRPEIAEIFSDHEMPRLGQHATETDSA